MSQPAIKAPTQPKTNVVEKTSKEPLESPTSPLLNQALLVISLADKRFVARGMEVITLRESYLKEKAKLDTLLSALPTFKG